MLGALQRRGAHFGLLRPVLWIAPRRKIYETLYAPGLAAFGFDPYDRAAGLILVRARTMTEILWAMEEGLREPGIGAVVAELPMGSVPDLTASRRLQLAAEAGGTMALLLHDGGHLGPNVGAGAGISMSSGTYSGANSGKTQILPPSACLTRWLVASRAAPSETPESEQIVEGVSGAGPPFFDETPYWQAGLVRCKGAAPQHWALSWLPRQKNEIEDVHQEMPGGTFTEAFWGASGGINQSGKADRENPRKDVKKYKLKSEKKETTTCNFSMVSAFRDRQNQTATDARKPAPDPAFGYRLTGDNRHIG
jgi:hypothetical protein